MADGDDGGRSTRPGVIERRTPPAVTRHDHLGHFEDLFRSHADPWQYETLWSEEAKRRAVGAMLGSARVGRLLELGCGNGVSTMALRRRAHRVLAIDGSPTAVRLAREHVGEEGRCEVRQVVLPEEFPSGPFDAPFDAIVATEVLYYLPKGALGATLAAARSALRPTGRLVVTASVRPFGDREVSNERLFACVARVFGRPERVRVGGAWQAASYRRR